MFEGPIDGDHFAMAGGFDLAVAGYIGEEWFLSGSARSYSLRGELRNDGRWEAQRAGSAGFRTRIVVRRPRDSARWNGTVFVEWMNVTGGLDAAPVWLFVHRHLVREGAAWIGVSAQKVGIDGGGLVPGMPLKRADAERYASLEHPGDAFAYGIFSEVGRALRSEAAGPLGGLRAERLIAVGESQSAGFLVTYVNAVDPIEQGFDGFLIHGRPGSAAGVDGSYIRSSPSGDLSRVPSSMTGGHRVREDLRVPVLTLQSETDVITLGGGHARQPDSDRFRLWELAGAAHFDTYGLVATHFDDGRLEIAELAERLAPTDRPMGLPASAPINAGPQQHYVAQAALGHLDRQVRDGTPPPEAPRLASTDAEGQALVRDEHGIVRGGIRTPWVDAPSAVLSGLGQTGEGFLFLFGTTLELEPAALARLYPGGADEHRLRFAEATEAALSAGFLLEADAQEIRALGDYGRQPSGWRRAEV